MDEDTMIDAFSNSLRLYFVFSGSETGRPEEDTFGVSIAVGLAGFACVLLLVLFVLINKYGRRNKFDPGGCNIGYVSKHPSQDLEKTEAVL
uniref:Uncharacterized protein n=1 Tax=Knipowitschia caucasica TaxID=637954 RepID=A0AAV2LRR1_KNICA